MVPRWAMKLIADAQVPNGRWIHFKVEGTTKEIVTATVRWCVQSALRIVTSKALMQMIAEKKIPLT